MNYNSFMQIFSIFFREINDRCYLYAPMKKNTVLIGDRNFEVFITEEQISASIAKVAKKINNDYSNKNPLFICVLNGAFMYAADLLRAIHIPCEITFIRVSSYSGTTSTGEVKEIVGLTLPLENRNIIIIEDIVDTGLTVKRLTDQFIALKANSVEVTTMLQKPEALEHELHIKYPCIEIPNAFVIGYGLDLDGQARNLSEIYIIKD